MYTKRFGSDTGFTFKYTKHESDTTRLPALILAIFKYHCRTILNVLQVHTNPQRINILCRNPDTKQNYAQLML